MARSTTPNSAHGGSPDEGEGDAGLARLFAALARASDRDEVEAKSAGGSP